MTVADPLVKARRIKAEKRDVDARQYVADLEARVIELDRDYRSLSRERSRLLEAIRDISRASDQQFNDLMRIDETIHNTVLQIRLNQRRLEEAK